jgi:5-methyltetrahydrofolate--homocysteine methyltransferase
MAAAGTAPRAPRPLAFKPDLADAARRWEAFYAGELIDRPPVCVTAPMPGLTPGPWPTYRERAHADPDALIDRVLAIGGATFWGGEAVPAWYPGFGPDEIAAFCGGRLQWDPDSGDTSWSVPFVEDWDRQLPLRLIGDDPMWRRVLGLYRRAADRFAGKMLLSPLDLHSNMDLLSAARGPERLCMDLLDCPDTIDRAMESARAVFPVVWKAVAEAGRMDELGYSQGIFSTEGAAYLQCDFSCMMSPGQFRRWVLPALEEEAAIVRHHVYHWDGPGALVHTDALVASPALHTLSYVPGEGRGTCADYVDLYRRVQARGKAVQVWGSAEVIKQVHPQIRPEKVFYSCSVDTRDEAERLLEWFAKNT